MKLLTTVIVLTGIFAQECNIGDLGLADFSDKVVVTNTSDVADAFVAVKSNHGSVTMFVESGKSGTAIFLASTEYLVKVTDPGSRDYGTYRDQLLATRDWLRDIIDSGYTTNSNVVEVWTQLVFVQEALSQMTEGGTIQSCSGKLTTDAPSHVTLQWLQASDGTPFWALDCG